MQTETQTDRPDKRSRASKEKSVSKREDGSTGLERETAAQERQALLETMSSKGIHAEAALSILAEYKEVSEEDQQEQAEAYLGEYGLAIADLPPLELKKLQMLLQASRGTKRKEVGDELTAQIELDLRKQLIEQGIHKLDALHAKVIETENPKETKEILQQYMGRMSALAQHVPPEDPQNRPYWDSIYVRFRAISEVKKQGSKVLQQAFEEVFSQYEDFIEAEFFDATFTEMSKNYFSGEDTMRELFARTPEDVEELKKRNRKNLVEYVLLNKDKEPSAALLEELHRINNKGVVPASISRLRKEGENVAFGKGRVGTLGEDVQEEIEHVMARAEWMHAQNHTQTIYEIAVAKLHNDILNIHPFVDRNGSTSFVFAEFMMAKRGYVPEKDREGGYYGQVRKVLGNNPIAIAVLGGIQYEIARVPGYFKGKTAENKRSKYEGFIRKVMSAKEEALKNAENN